MKLIPLRQLRTTAVVRKALAAESEIVVTANGRPFAIIASVDPGRLDEDLMAIRRAQAFRALDRIQARAKAMGLHRMTMREIDALIAKVRRERKERQGRQE